MKNLILRVTPELLARWRRVLEATNRKGIDVLTDLVESWVASEEAKLLAPKEQKTELDERVAETVVSFFDSK